MPSKAFLIFLCISCLPLILAAQKVKRKGETVKRKQKNELPARYHISQLSGKWQEIKRESVSSKTSIDFSDSLVMIFRDNNVTIKDIISMRMTMNGDAEIEAPDMLIAAGDSYSILFLDTQKLIIKDDSLTRVLEKREHLSYEQYGKDTIRKDSLSEPVITDMHTLKGNWFIYSRKAEPGTVTGNTALIKSLEVNTVNDDGIAFGKVLFYVSGITKSADCQLVTQRGMIKIITEQDSWTFTIYKADGKEFIFGEKGKLVYFAKIQ